MRRKSRSRLCAACPTQRGAATLVVVMVLFFIVALVAAYTSRNLIFEQRTAANQYRATQAFEAAEAGLEWGLAMLNSGRIDAVCQPHVNPATADESFRQRYLDIVDIAPDAGRVTARLRADGQPRQAACVFDGNGWQCSCPVDAAPVLADPAGSGPFPAFVLRFYDVSPDALPVPYPPGVVRIESTGCTRLDAGTICAATATSGDGRATVTSLAALKRALVTPPAAAVTVRGNLKRDGAAATWEVVNADLASGGVTVHAGGAVSSEPPATWPTAGRPGTPEGQSFFENDTQMQMPNMNAEQMFTSVFGILRKTYRLQPAAVFVDCAVDCAAATVRDLALLNPGRILWINGDFDINIADPIGPPNSPVMLVVTGDISISDPGASLNGVLYMAGASWQHGGGGNLILRGALISETAIDLTVSGAGTAFIEYRRELLDRLHWTHGSFVRVPGSWRDF